MKHHLYNCLNSLNTLNRVEYGSKAKCRDNVTDEFSELHQLVTLDNLIVNRFNLNGSRFNETHRGVTFSFDYKENITIHIGLKKPHKNHLYYSVKLYVEYDNNGKLVEQFRLNQVSVSERKIPIQPDYRFIPTKHIKLSEYVVKDIENIFRHSTYHNSSPTSLFKRNWRIV